MTDQDRATKVHSTVAPPARVLLCDDTRDVLLLLSTEFDLDPELAIVATAANGLEGVEAAARTQPDLVVLDLAMPVMDGFEALPRILRVAPRARVVVLSGFDSPEVEACALELGAARFLVKGTPLDEILARCKEVLAAPAAEPGRPAPPDGS